MSTSHTRINNEKTLPKETLIRQTKYLNNIVEQDHRFIKKITKPMLGFKTFRTAEQTLKGIEAMQHHKPLIFMGLGRIGKYWLTPCKRLTYNSSNMTLLIILTN
ncbi:DDE-type integrase/transposase/recombinase [Paenibacillus sp. N3.4]|nr:DDE-type integrase/transposase/recombinase [Paenibacillus sp. N3.4]